MLVQRWHTTIGVMLCQRWPNISVPTLGQCWHTVGPTLVCHRWANVGPIDKSTLAQRWWADIGPTRGLTLGQRWANVAMLAGKAWIRSKEYSRKISPGNLHDIYSPNGFLGSIYIYLYILMMTSSNGNIFRVTGPLCGNSPVTGEFPSQRPVTRSFDVFFDLRLNKDWVNNREAGDLWRHRAHHDVTVMFMGGGY